MDYQKIQNNQNKNLLLIDVLKNNGILFDENDYMINLKFIDNGRYSNVFEILNTNKVLKITSFKNEYESAINLINLQKEEQSLKYYFEIPLVIAPKNILTENKYYIILNKLNQLNNEERKIFDEILNYFDCENIEDIYDFLWNDETEEQDAIENHEEQVFNYLINNSIKYDNEYIKPLMNFIFIIYNYCINFELTDIHVDNIMKDENGNYKVIDVQ